MIFWRHSLSPCILLGQVKPLSIFFLEAVVRVVILTDSWMRYWTLKDNRNNNNRNLKVARYSFLRSIPPKFERKLRRHKQRLGKMDTTVILDKDETLLLSGLQWHRSCHGNEMTPLPILLAAVFLGTGNCSSKIVYWTFFLQ